VKVVITAAAKRDLIGIAGYIRPHNHGVRRCVHADYLIFYRVRTDFVEVIHILHGARDYEALLFPNH
jgi:plasmid stabilization system protein ParE